MPKSKHTIKSETKRKVISKVRFYISKYKFDEAIHEIDEYIANNSNCNYLLVFRSYALFRKGNRKQALKEMYDMLNTMNLTINDSIFAMSMYAEMLYREGDEDNAIYYLQRVINESNTLELIARGKLSKIYMGQKKYDEALKVLEIEDFNNMFLNVKRAKIYVEKNDWEQVLPALNRKEINTLKYELKEYISDDRINQEKEFILGDMYFKQGNLDKAMKHLYEAVAIKKNSGTFFKAYMDIVRIHIMRFNLNEAISICEEMKNESTSTIYLTKFSELLAKAYERKNDYENAEKYYKNADTSEIKRNGNLAKLELTKGNFEKAEEYFSYTTIKSEDVRRSYDIYYKIVLVKYRLKKYDEAQYIINIMRENLDLSQNDQNQINFELNRIDLLIRKEKNEIIEDNNYVYTQKQILSYSDFYALEHIKKHHVTDAKTSTFYDNIDIKEVYEYAKERIKDEPATYDCIFDKYIIKYNNIGFNTKTKDNINQLMILTLPNTTNIITMFPCDGSESVFTLEEFEEKEKPKVKRLSQIEKFNKKYGNN